MECRNILAIDMGTTRIKTGVVECSSLRIVSRGSVETPIRYPREGWAEQDPEELWNAVVEASRTALEGVDPGSVSGIVTSTYLAGLVLLDEEGNELTPIITWLDERAHGLPRSLFKGPIKVSGYNLPRLLEMLHITGGAPSKTGKDPLSKIAWIAENQPEALEKAKTIGGLKTWILNKLARVHATTPDEAHLTWLADTRRGRAEWSMRLARRYRVPYNKLPRIIEASSLAGGLAREAAQDLGLEEGTPVIAGSGDVAAAGVGSGALGEREYHIYLGTSSWIGVHTPKRLLDVFHYIGSLLSAAPGLYIAIAEQEAAGALIDKVLHLLGGDYSMLEEASKIPPGSEGLLAAPWLYGERSPIDDPDARGVLVGLSLRHGRLHLVRAAMEAVALNIAWAWGYMTRLAGAPVRLRGVGGGFRSRTWARIIASALGRPIEVVEEPGEAPLRGVAVMAAAGLRGSSIAGEASRIRVAYRVEPDPSEARVYSGMLEAYRLLYKRLRPLFKAIPG